MSEPDATLRRSIEELRLKTVSNTEAWGLAATKRWDADFDTGLITFQTPGFIVTASVQFISTYYDDDGSWFWGWSHPEYDQRLLRDARLVRDFGERYALGRLTNPEIRCTEDEAWQFTALACHLAGAAGAYRGRTGEAAAFMTFHGVTIRRA